MSDLERLKILDEVLQAMYWMHAEGISSVPTADELSRFLGVPSGTLAPHLEGFADDGLLEREAGGYRLSAEGEQRGKRTFADEFAGLTGASHGECDENCWCHDSPEAAASCLEERSGHAHQH
ncbi:MAG TPA: hypothetical protein VM266_17340 [Solirubrobacteraceae bacterium]|nr:hypothetical protein [Solirubrobacteraceae bacterium]